MPNTFDRRIRVADLLKQEIANLLLEHTRDPRFTFVSITSVEIAKDYSTAKVFVTVLDDSKIRETLAALNKAAGYFRYQLAQIVNLRTTPKLHFYYDETIASGQKIEQLLNPKSSNDNSDKE